MIAFKQLESWKACHALTLAVHEAVKPFLGREPDIADRLRLAALLSASKLARGAGTGNERMFRQCAELSAGYLSEIAYFLSLARAMGLMPEETWRELDALRGRASFYVWKHVLPKPPKDVPDLPAEDTLTP